MQSFCCLSYNKICYTFQKHFTKRTVHYKITKYQLLLAAATQLLKHTNTSVKGKQYIINFQLLETLGQNTRVKTLQTFNIFFHFHLFFEGLANTHRTPSTITTWLDNSRRVFSTLLCYSMFAGCPWDTERVAVTSTQIPYPCWTLQSNTERNLPRTLQNSFHLKFTSLFA